jgi:hypothetical protein
MKAVFQLQNITREAQFDVRVYQQHTWRQKICYHNYPSPPLYCGVRGEGAAAPTVSTICYSKNSLTAFQNNIITS